MATSSNKVSISSFVICGNEEDIDDDGDVGGVVNSDAHDDASSSVFIDGGVNDLDDVDVGTCQRIGDVATSLVAAAFNVDQSTGDEAASRRVGVANVSMTRGVVIEG